MKQKTNKQKAYSISTNHLESSYFPPPASLLLWSKLPSSHLHLLPNYQPVWFPCLGTRPQQPVLKAASRVILLGHKSDHVTLLLELLQCCPTHSEKEPKSYNGLQGSNTCHCILSTRYATPGTCQLYFHLRAFAPPAAPTAYNVLHRYLQPSPPPHTQTHNLLPSQ